MLIVNTDFERTALARRDSGELDGEVYSMAMEVEV